MTKCDHVEGLLKRLLAGKSSVQVKEAIFEHMMDCLPCVDKFKAAIKEKRKSPSMIDKEYCQDCGSAAGAACKH